jgi:hypothetical protein
MGIEYEIRFNYTSAKDVESVLRSTLFFTGFNPAFSCYEFRGRENQESMPDAVAVIETYGIYFRDNGGQGKNVIDEILEKVNRSFGVAKVEEL